MKITKKRTVQNPRRLPRCHIVGHGPAGIYRGNLCGCRPSVNHHGGISVATCRRCLQIALREGDRDHYAPGVFRAALQRARRLGVRHV